MAQGTRACAPPLAALAFAALAALAAQTGCVYETPPAATTAARPGANDNAGARPSASPSATAAATPQVEAAPKPEAAPTPGASPSTPTDATQQGADALASMRLLIPVEGVRAEQLQDTFEDARSEGRVHDAIDIMAPRNAPVVAATDGRVVKLFRSVKGGITLYQLAASDEHLVLYYAHLERYADGLKEGYFARRGETLGYVGDTGNAVPGNTHLHFQIYRVADPKRFWTGDNLNPYPLLRGAR